MAATRIAFWGRWVAVAGLVVLGSAGGGCGGGSGSGGTPPPSDVEIPLCAAQDLGPAPLRRLTRFEYGRSLHDLTGADVAVAADLPPDEETLGFDDIASAYSVSSLHATKYLEVAEKVAADFVSDGGRLTAVAGCDPTSGDGACVGDLIAAFGRRAWRRPLEEDERAVLQQLYTDNAPESVGEGLSAVISAILQAPQFLYRPEAAPAPAVAATSEPVSGYELATRLSFLLSGSTPDDALLDAAAAGRLDTEEGLLAQADRLLAAPGAEDVFARFVTEWWELQTLPTVDKDRSLYRRWTDGAPAALAQETRLFLGDTWRGSSTLRALLTTPATFVDGDLAEFYGLAAPAGGGFARVSLDPARGAGMFTQGSFLATHAKADQTSPVLRGKFVRARLFCTPPDPPPPDIVVRPPTVDPRLPTRQRYAQHVAEPRCAACHVYMDPIGFAFEHYDAAGRWRDTDGNQPVDATGSLTATDVDGPLDGVPSLANRLAGSAQVGACAAREWFHYAFGRNHQTSGDGCTIDALAGALTREGGDLRNLVRATVRMPAFRTRVPQAATTEAQP